MRGKRHHDLLSKTCCLTVPENFGEETVRVSEKLWNLEKLRIGERERERERESEREGHQNFQRKQSVASQN